MHFLPSPVGLFSEFLCPVHHNNKIDFQSILDSNSIEASDHKPEENYAFTLIPPNISFETVLNTQSRTEAITAYQKQVKQSDLVDTPASLCTSHGDGMGESDWEKYKDDQLLSNPGGDHYYLGQKN